MESTKDDDMGSKELQKGVKKLKESTTNKDYFIAPGIEYQVQYFQKKYIYQQRQQTHMIP